MTEKKTVLIVPGFKEGLGSRDYTSVIKALEAKGYEVEFVPINWLRTTIDDWTRQLNVLYEKYDAKNTILAGFSFGAMNVFNTASSRQPAELWLCSLSPYFSEDLKFLKPTWLAYIAKHREKNFKEMKFNELSKNITCPTKLFIGELEAKKYPSLEKRVKEAGNRIKNSKMHYIEGVGHDIAHPSYIKTIVENI